MRLAVISDIHGNLTAFEAVLADLDSVGDVDLIWNLGDLAAFGPRPVECIRKSREMVEQYGKDKVKVIGGNNDRYMVTGERFPRPAAKDAEAFAVQRATIQTFNRMIDWNVAQLDWDDYEYLTKILHRETAKSIEGYGTVIGCHAIPGDDEGMALLPNSDDELARDALLDRQGMMAVVGHTHQRMDRDLGNWRVVNPGSVGLSFTQKGAAEWALLTFDDKGGVEVDLRLVPYDVDAVIADLEKTGHPEAAWLTGKLR